MYASAGYCDIYSDNEGTLTAPVIMHEMHPLSVRPLQGCRNEGVYDVDGCRACETHIVTMLELSLLVGNHADVSLIGR